MAYLRDTNVTGKLTVTDAVRLRILEAPSTAGGTTYTAGTSGYILRNGGGSIYWNYVSDSTSASAISTNNYIVTERDIYYGLPTVNGSHTYNSNTTYFSATAAGTSGQILTWPASGSIPVWQNPAPTFPSGGTTGQALVKASNTDNDVAWGNVGGLMTPITANTQTYYVTGSSVTTENINAALFDTSIYVTGNKLYGAAWNDYAEYRETHGEIEPGCCIIENGDGTLSLSTKRLQAGAEIVSDTFGFAIGKTKKCNTPVAASGRVLAFTDKDRNSFKIGAPVCSGANGTISQMTDEEARNYPWLIIGTVSSIPQELYWGEHNIPVKNRIWVRIR